MSGWKECWYFPHPIDTENLLEKVGFKKIKVYLSEALTDFPDQTSYAMFVRTVVAKPFLDYLPNEELKVKFWDLYLDKIKQTGLGWILDYVRLNISASK